MLTPPELLAVESKSHVGEVNDNQRATMLELLDYDNPLGLHPNEARWRNFARVEIRLRETRIKQLERLNAVLAAECDRQRPIVEAAVNWAHGEEWGLAEAVNTYEKGKANG